jgi:hypothetical protein
VRRRGFESCDALSVIVEAARESGGFRRRMLLFFAREI